MESRLFDEWRRIPGGKFAELMEVITALTSKESSALGVLANTRSFAMKVAIHLRT